MRLDEDGTVVLSRRNLMSLLHKLEDPASQRELTSGTPNVVGGVGRVTVKAETDAEHYGPRMAGRVHPDHDPGRDDDGPIEP